MRFENLGNANRKAALCKITCNMITNYKLYAVALIATVADTCHKDTARRLPQQQHPPKYLDPISKPNTESSVLGSYPVPQFSQLQVPWVHAIL